MRKQGAIVSFRGEHSFLSNFHPSVLKFEGVIYPTAEHAFQAAKTLDPVQRTAIARCRTPGQAKRMGRAVDLRPFWNDIRVDVMENVLHDKFNNHVISRFLVETHPRVLVEGNTWSDRFWGAVWLPKKNVIAEKNERVWVMYKGRSGLVGQNQLGQLLMKIRKGMIDD